MLNTSASSSIHSEGDRSQSDGSFFVDDEGDKPETGFTSSTPKDKAKASITENTSNKIRIRLGGNKKNARKSSVPAFSCIRCECTFKKSHQYDEHIANGCSVQAQQESFDREKLRSKKKIAGSKKPSTDLYMNCTVCGALLTTKYMKEHTRAKHPELWDTLYPGIQFVEIKCEKCGLRFPHRQSLKRHRELETSCDSNV